MDAHFQQLVEVCQRGILELKEPTWNTSELDNCHNQRIPFDLAIWRQRLGMKHYIMSTVTNHIIIMYRRGS